MDERTSRVIEEIKKYTRIKKFSVFICFSFLAASCITIVFYSIYSSNYVTKYVIDKDYIAGKKLQKVMTNPRIKFEYKEGQFYNIKASRAIHENNDSDVLLLDVEAKSDTKEIKSGKLIITNSGDDLYFSEKPVLIIKQPQNQKAS